MNNALTETIPRTPGSRSFSMEPKAVARRRKTATYRIDGVPVRDCPEHGGDAQTDVPEQMDLAEQTPRELGRLLRHRSR